MRDNHLYKKQQNRYLNQRKLKPVTVCIAAICNVGIPNVTPAIIFCADRLVSAGIQFEGGESKIKQFTNYCYTMQSSSDSLISDLILERAKEKIGKSEKPLKIEEIVKIIHDECVAYKTEWIDRAILSNYNVAFEKFKVTPESIVQKAVDEVKFTEIPYAFDIIVLGLEESKEAHIFVIKQDGSYKSYDSIGFATIGSGGELAFLELTKYMYSRSIGSLVAVPRVYIAKKVSERAQGVGRFTDLLVLFFTDLKTFSPAIHVLSSFPNFINTLDEAYRDIRKSEAEAIQKLSEVVGNMVNPPKPAPTQAEPAKQT